MNFSVTLHLSSFVICFAVNDVISQLGSSRFDCMTFWDLRSLTFFLREFDTFCLRVVRVIFDVFEHQKVKIKLQVM